MKLFLRCQISQVSCTKFRSTDKRKFSPSENTAKRTNWSPPN